MQPLLTQSPGSPALLSAEEPDSDQLFTRLWPTEASRWPGFTSSVILHVLVVLLIPPISARIEAESDRRIWARQERLMRTLRIRVPERLYVASTGRRVPEEPKRAAQRPKPAPAPAAAKPQAPAPSETRRAAAPRRRFDLPPAQHRTQSSQSLIQPLQPPDLLPQPGLRLPEVFFWAPPVARMPPKPFVQPGHAVPPARPRVLDAPPRLELPTVTPTAPLQLAQLTTRSPLETLPDSQPIRTSYPDQPSERTGVSGDPLPGDPTNVLSISSDPLPLREFLAVPPGNQIGKTPETGGQTGPLSGTGSGGSGSGSGTGPGGSRSETGTGTGTGAEGSGEGDASPNAIAWSPAVNATRIEHPSTGVFDVVVQSSALEGFPESAGVLSGKPIYSVFLAVGAPKDWILQYCIPFSEERPAEASGAVIKLGNPAPLTAPFPRVTFRPFFDHRPGTYLMLHGFITPQGKFQDLRLIGAGDPRATAVVIAILNRWEFRPATQDGRPVRVEILLAIPGE